MDRTVQLHHIDANPATSPPAASSTPSPRAARNPRRAHVMGRRLNTRRLGRNGEESDDDESEEDTARTADVQTTTFNCHKGRVKEIQIHPEEPHLFWSVSEDGSVRQYDIRLPNSTQEHFTSNNVLLAVQKKGVSNRFLELKSLSLNPLRPMQLAVAASDHYVRLYDRRKLSLAKFSWAGDAGTGGAPQGLTAILMPPQLALGPIARGQTRGYTQIHPTHITFCSLGNSRLATYHSDHAYAWTDLLGGARESDSAQIATTDIHLNPASWNFHRKRPTHVHSPGSNSTLFGGYGGFSSLGPGMLSPAAEKHRTEGNLAMFQRESLEAIKHYTAALRAAPDSALLYASRALAFLLRSWVGDKAEALRDAEEAVYCDPNNALAQLRRAQALRDCQFPLSASVAAKLCRQCMCQEEREKTRGGGGTGTGGVFEFEEDLKKLETNLEVDMQASHARRMMRHAQQAQRREGRRRCGLDGDSRRRRRSGSDENVESPSLGEELLQGGTLELDEHEPGQQQDHFSSTFAYAAGPSGTTGGTAGAGGTDSLGVMGDVGHPDAEEGSFHRVPGDTIANAYRASASVDYEGSSDDEEEEERRNDSDPFGILFTVLVDEAFAAELESGLRNGPSEGTCIAFIWLLSNDVFL